MEDIRLFTTGLQRASTTMPTSQPPSTLILAPLQGVTQRAYRNCFARHFDGLAAAVAPFVTTLPGARIKPSHLKDLASAETQPLPLIPQILGKEPDHLAPTLKAITDLGYQRCDLNAGCPWPMIVRKGRGAGLLGDPDNLRRMLDCACTLMPTGFSIKVRLGLATTDLLAARMELLNSYPLHEVTIHARCASQRYEGRVDLDAFATALALCRHPVCYNGDLKTVADFHYLRQRFPTIKRWMLGRGVITDPFLPESLTAATRPLTTGRLHHFLDDYYTTLQSELCGPTPLLGRLKELWSYLHLRFTEGDQLWRRIRTCHHPDDYLHLLNAWWSNQPQLQPQADGIV